MIPSMSSSRLLSIETITLVSQAVVCKLSSSCKENDRRWSALKSRCPSSVTLGEDHSWATSYLLIFACVWLTLFYMCAAFSGNFWFPQIQWVIKQPLFVETNYSSLLSRQQTSAAHIESWRWKKLKVRGKPSLKSSARGVAGELCFGRTPSFCFSHPQYLMWWYGQLWKRQTA